MYLENRCIAVLDVLGFADQITNKNGLLRTIEAYRTAITTTLNHLLTTRSSLAPQYDAPHVEVAKFVFDNLVLVSYSLDSKAGADSFMSAVSGIMAHFASAHLPLRGAIGLGDFVTDEETNLFLSNVFKPLNKALSEQDWAGCCIHPDFEEELLMAIPEIKKAPKDRSSGLYLYPVPIKGGTTRELWCLNWLYQLSAAEISSLLTFLQGDKNKHRNTSAFVDFYGSFPCNKVELEREFEPAKYASLTRLGKVCSMTFWDADGNPCNPGCKHIVYHQNHANSIGTGFVGSENDEKLKVRQLERWGKYYP